MVLPLGGGHQGEVRRRSAAALSDIGRSELEAAAQRPAVARRSPPRHRRCPTPGDQTRHREADGRRQCAEGPEAVVAYRGRRVDSGRGRVAGRAIRIGRRPARADRTWTGGIAVRGGKRAGLGAWRVAGVVAWDDDRISEARRVYTGAGAPDSHNAADDRAAV